MGHVALTPRGEADGLGEGGRVAVRGGGQLDRREREGVRPAVLEHDHRVLPHVGAVAGRVILAGGGGSGFGFKS